MQVTVDKPLGIHDVLHVDFNWPMEVANGKWLLYVEKITMTGTSESLCVPPGDIVNPNNFQVRHGLQIMTPYCNVHHLNCAADLNLKQSTLQYFLFTSTISPTKTRSWNCSQFDDIITSFTFSMFSLSLFFF